ncbi:MAG: HD domain-containing protein, partial [Candidatus Sericytochromatia bacterium]|nr:HD domain-containing protein [Candidatus Tanganyikabacteria bacterium]
HDIGKTAVPRQILQKEGALTQREFEIMKHHTTIGADNLLGHLPELRPLLNMIRQHHERPTGGGYPLGLKSAEIDPLAKIVSIADAFDAMTSSRSYRPGMPVAQAKDRLRKAARNGQLDAALVEAFIRALEFKRGGQVIPVAERFREVVGKAS